MRNPAVEQQYAEALDGLRLLAQRDLLSWWEQTANLAWADQTRLMEEPFAEIVRTYGEQASYAAADYLFLQRSLSDTLSGLEYPEVADPVGFEQARKSFRWAMETTRTIEDENGELQADRDIARSKLAGITNRLVASPARKTVEAAVSKAGTKYARVPEPGACPFCLMLASRGAVYTRDTVLKASNMGSYHDNCRCLGIESEGDHDLPRVNQELQELWKDTAEEYGDTPDIDIFGEALRRQRDGTTPPWIPIDAKRINQLPKHNRGPVPTTLNRKQIEEHGLLDTPTTRPETPRNRQDQDTWDKEQRIIDWLTDHGAEDIHRVGKWEDAYPGEKQKTPDVVIGDRTTDFKTIGPKKIPVRAGEAATQGQNVIMDLRDRDVTPETIDGQLRNAVRDYGDRLDMIVILTDRQTYFWER